ncbi:MAG: class I SAM-dependent methyltransferase, partial [Candidatus Lokiarchaeota archaeon]|nr:class I SAM-dependent methyltransferase [Candidatus Lokiarchaeota archaeon]
MDIWKYYSITHEDHSILNPISSTKLDHLVDVINLKENSNVLDIACGTGELLVRLVEKYNISGLGIDLS